MTYRHHSTKNTLSAMMRNRVSRRADTAAHAQRNIALALDRLGYAIELEATYTHEESLRPSIYHKPTRAEWLTRDYYGRPLAFPLA